MNDIANAARLYFRYFGASIRAQLQYRASVIVGTLSQFVIIGLEIVGIWAMFDRFGSLRGWRLEEIALFYGLVNTGFALAEAFGRGFDVFPDLIKSGGFDRLMLRPRRLALQVASQELRLHRAGRLLQGLIVLAWAAARLQVQWDLPRVGLVVLTIAGGACLFYGLFVLQATLAFWTIQSLEIMNAVTYGGTETGQYPMSIYRPWFRKFFTFVIPLACVSYFPALAILGRRDEALSSPLWFQCLAPLIGVAFMLVSFQAWKLGVRHYRSTGS